MKKLIFLTALILMVGMTYGQTLQKGNLIGTHIFTVTLAPGVTMDKYVDFFNAKVIPEIVKVYPEWKCYVLKGVRGEHPNSYGVIYVIKSQKDRDKYYNADGTDSELGKQANAKMKPILDEWVKLGTYDSKYTDWVVL
jgi:hypothetical protein